MVARALGLTAAVAGIIWLAAVAVSAEGVR